MNAIIGEIICQNHYRIEQLPKVTAGEHPTIGFSVVKLIHFHVSVCTIILFAGLKRVFAVFFLVCI